MVQHGYGMAHTPAGQQIERLQETLNSVLESPNAQAPVNLELEQQRMDGNMLPVENVDMGHDIELIGFGHVEAQLVAGPEHQLLIKVRVTSTEFRLLFAKALVVYPGELVHSCVFMRADSSMIFFIYPIMLASSWESAEVWRSHVYGVKSLVEVITSFWRRLADLHGRGISPGPVELADIVINNSGKNTVRFINMKKLTNFSASKASQDIIDGAKVMLHLLLPGHFTREELNDCPFTPAGWEKCGKNLPPPLVDILRLAANGEKSAEHTWMLCGQAEKHLSEYGVQCTGANPTAVADDRFLAPPVSVSDNQESPAIDGRYPPVLCSIHQESLATASHQASFIRPSVMNQYEDNKGLNCKLVAGGIHGGAHTIPAPAVRSDLSNINFSEDQSSMAESHSSGLNSLTNQKNIGFDRNVSYVTNDTTLISQVDSEAISLNPQQANGDKKASGKPSQQTSGIGTMSTFDSHGAHSKSHQGNSHQSNTARQPTSMAAASVGRIDSGPTSGGVQPKNGTAADVGGIESGSTSGGARPKSGSAAGQGRPSNGQTSERWQLKGGTTPGQGRPGNGQTFGGARPKDRTDPGQGRPSNGQTFGGARPKDRTAPGQGGPSNGQTFGGARPKDRTAPGQGRPSNGQTSGRWRLKGGTTPGQGRPGNGQTSGRWRPKDGTATGEGRLDNGQTSGRWRPKGWTATGEGRLEKRPNYGRWRPKDETAAGSYVPHKNKPDTITDYMEHISKRKSGGNTRRRHTSSSSEDEE